MLVDEARRRAHDGWDEPVWHQGEQVGLVRKYDSTMLIFLIKRHFPEYRESSRLALTDADGGSIVDVVRKLLKEAPDSE